MKLRLLTALLAFATAPLLRAATTPLNTEIPDQTQTTIECETKEVPRPNDVPVFGTKDVPAKDDAKKVAGTYHYKLILPKGYSADAQRRWPCIFFMNGGGLDKNKDRLSGYIVVELVEARGTDWPAVVGDFLASHDDVTKRVRVQEGLKMVTGEYDGSRAASLVVGLRPGFSGLILESVGPTKKKGSDDYNLDGMKRDPILWVAMTMGQFSNDKKEADALTKQFGNARLRIFFYPAAGGWAPPATFSDALDWIEHKVYYENPLDPTMKVAYLHYFQDHLALYQAASSNWQKFKQGSDLLTFARARSLSMDPQAAPAIRDMQAVVQQLQRDPVVGKESVADSALQALLAQQNKMSSPKFSDAALALMKAYPGTEAAAKAQVIANINPDAVATPGK